VKWFDRYNHLRMRRVAVHPLTDLFKMISAGLKGELETNVKYTDVEIVQTVTPLSTQLLLEYVASGV
jgi:hypothetical protein